MTPPSPPSGSIAFGTAGAASTGGTTSISVAYPSGITAGDLLVLTVVNRPSTSTPSTPTGWTAVTNYTQTGGKGSEAADSGIVRSTIFIKEADGTESGNLSVTISGGTSAFGRMFRYTKGTGTTWSYAATNGSDTDNSNTTWSITGAGDPGITAGDMVIVASAINSDAAASALSSEALSSTGVTYGTATERQDSAISTGNHIRMVVSDHVVIKWYVLSCPGIHRNFWHTFRQLPLRCCNNFTIRLLKSGFCSGKDTR